MLQARMDAQNYGRVAKLMRDALAGAAAALPAVTPPA